MRHALLVAGLALGLGLCCQGLVVGYGLITDGALSPEARLAVQLRCGDGAERENRECRSTLKRLYLSGALDPDRTLRSYCDEVKTAPWGGRRPPAPAVCVERYGGWQAG